MHQMELVREHFCFQGIELIRQYIYDMDLATNETLIEETLKYW